MGQGGTTVDGALGAGWRLSRAASPVPSTGSAALPATPALRREQIKLQVALINATGSAHQRLCGAGNQGPLRSGHAC